MLRIKVLGSGSGISCKERFQSSIALINDDQSFTLLDCGEPAARQLVRYDLNLDNLDAVFISHLHADHVSGLFQLIQNMQIYRRTKPLKIIMPQEGHHPFRQFLDAIYLSDKVILFKLDLLTPQEATTFGTAQFCVARTRHLDDFARISGNPGEANSCILKFAADNQPLRIVYSGDLQTAGEIIPLLQKPTSLLIVEGAHFPMESLFDNINIAACMPEQVIITHIGPQMLNSIDKIQVQAAQRLKNNIVISHDGLELNI